MKFIAVGATVLALIASGAGAAVAYSEPTTQAATASATSATDVATAKVAAKKKKWEPKTGAFFNIPQGVDPQQQWVIERQIVAAINHTKKGEYIRISVFSFDRLPVADALIAARKRGVRVQILLNDHQQTPAMFRLYKGIGKNRNKRNFAYRCSHGCRTGYENLHSKFFLFSKTGGARNVVMLGSTNLTANAAINQWNDLYVMREQAKAYDVFVSLFKQMREDKKARPQYLHKKISSKYDLQVLPLPDFSPKNDPMMSALNKVRCTTAAGSPGGVKGRTMVRVNMHAWNTVRGEWLAEKVRSLYGAGCDVKVMYGMASKNIRDVFATKTKRGAVPVHINGYDTDEDDLIDLYGHLKVLTVAGHWGDDRSARMTWTGSSNWSNSGMRGDEIIWRMKGNGILRDYHANFNYIWRNGSHLAKYIDYGNGAAVLRQASPPKAGGPAWEND